MSCHLYATFIAGLTDRRYNWIAPMNRSICLSRCAPVRTTKQIRPLIHKHTYTQLCILVGLHVKDSPWTKNQLSSIFIQGCAECRIAVESKSNRGCNQLISLITRRRSRGKRRKKRHGRSLLARSKAMCGTKARPPRWHSPTEQLITSEAATTGNSRSPPCRDVRFTVTEVPRYYDWRFCIP